MVDLPFRIKAWARQANYDAIECRTSVKNLRFLQKQSMRFTSAWIVVAKRGVDERKSGRIPWGRRTVLSRTSAHLQIRVDSSGWYIATLKLSSSPQRGLGPFSKIYENVAHTLCCRAAQAQHRVRVILSQYALLKLHNMYLHLLNKDDYVLEKLHLLEDIQLLWQVLRRQGLGRRLLVEKRLV